MLLVVPGHNAIKREVGIQAYGESVDAADDSWDAEAAAAAAAAGAPTNAAGAMAKVVDNRASAWGRESARASCEPAREKVQTIGMGSQCELGKEGEIGRVSRGEAPVS